MKYRYTQFIMMKTRLVLGVVRKEVVIGADKKLEK